MSLVTRQLMMNNQQKLLLYTLQTLLTLFSTHDTIPKPLVMQQGQQPTTFLTGKAGRICTLLF